MRALSVWQPWAWLMLWGPKRIENRPWKPPRWAIGETVLVHAAKTYDDEGARYILEQMPELRSGWSPLAVTSGFIGSFRITGYLDKARGDAPPDGQAIWFFGPYGWLTDEPRRLARPLPWPGELGLFAVPPEAQTMIAEIGWAT